MVGSAVEQAAKAIGLISGPHRVVDAGNLKIGERFIDVGMARLETDSAAANLIGVQQDNLGKLVPRLHARVYYCNRGLCAK